MDSKQILLETFQDNNAHLITAADMRQFVTSVYDEKVTTEGVVNNLASVDPVEVLAAPQGNAINQRLVILESAVSTKEQEIIVLQNSMAVAQGDIATLQAQMSNIVNLLGTGANGTIDTTVNSSLVVSSGVITSAS